MSKRIASTLALWIIVLGAIWFFRASGAVFLITAISLLTLREFYQLLHDAGMPVLPGTGLILGLVVTLAPCLGPVLPTAAALPALVVVIVAARVLALHPEIRLEAFAGTILGLVYVPGMLQFLVRLVVPQSGDAVSAEARLIFTLWVVAVAKFCDVGALLTGMAIGRHHLAPRISPKKTWEGAAGGVLTAVGMGALVAWLAQDLLGVHLSPGRAALIAAPVAIAAIVADLVESMLKRRARSKDSGAIIPGIGGVFDMTDSLLLAAPVGYLLLGLS